MATLNDFSTIKTHVDKINQDQLFVSQEFGFYYLVLDLLFNLQDSEIDEIITDSHYLSKSKGSKGHDRGIDGVYINEDESKIHIHLFNFKYVSKFEKINSHFPSSEIDKVVNFINNLLSKNSELLDNCNPVLSSKIREIWEMYDKCSPIIIVHLCSNTSKGLEKTEQARFESELAQNNLKFEYHFIDKIVKSLTSKDKKIVSGKIRAIDKNFFEKSEGDIRALIVDVDARDLLRLIIDDEQTRNNVEIDDYMSLSKHRILEDAFEDNVRIYLRQRSKINRNIKETALSDQHNRFFYYNNGITLTCKNFTYSSVKRAPIIEIEDIQIVNGSQTLHALHDAFCKKPENFESIDILCRIYQTANNELSTNIAEYTNSQNPVQTRDIRSNDYIQRKIESEMRALGYYYERKKNQHRSQQKEKRIDAEKAGQAIMAYYEEMPAEAKDKKRDIFADKYDIIFNDDITAEKILCAVFLLNKIENLKIEKRKDIMKGENVDHFLLHASFHILYLLKNLAHKNGIAFDTISKINDVWGYYDRSVDMIRHIVNDEKNTMENNKERFSHRHFFKGKKPKTKLVQLLEDSFSA